MTPDLDFPKAGVLLNVEDGVFEWIMPVCPICGGRHSHGGGRIEAGDDPRQALSWVGGHRVPHCERVDHWPEGSLMMRMRWVGYILIDADPARTRKILRGIKLAHPGKAARR